MVLQRHLPLESCVKYQCTKGFHRQQYILRQPTFKKEERKKEEQKQKRAQFKKTKSVTKSFADQNRQEKKKTFYLFLAAPSGPAHFSYRTIKRVLT